LVAACSIHVANETSIYYFVYASLISQHDLVLSFPSAAVVSLLFPYTLYDQYDPLPYEAVI